MTPLALLSLAAGAALTALGWSDPRLHSAAATLAKGAGLLVTGLILWALGV